MGGQDVVRFDKVGFKMTLRLEVESYELETTVSEGGATRGQGWQLCRETGVSWLEWEGEGEVV